MSLPRITFTHGPALPPVSGRALVTGASSGIGWSCAEVCSACLRRSSSRLTGRW